MVLNKYSKKSKKSNNTALILLAIIAIFIFGVGLLVKATKKDAETKLYGYEALGEEVHSYLSTSSHYGGAYNSGKMLVVYYHPKDERNEYFGNFKSALNDLSRVSEIRRLYRFVTFLREEKMGDDKDLVRNEKMFKKMCRSFCIVNPQRRELYYYTKVRTSDLTRNPENPRNRDVLEDDLKQLEFWGIDLKKQP